MAKDVKTSQDQLKKLLEAVEYAIKKKDETATAIEEADNEEEAMMLTITDFFKAFEFVQEEYKKYNDIRTEELEAIEESIQKGEGTGMWNNLFKTEGHRFK
jgi:hypothetical protein